MLAIHPSLPTVSRAVGAILALPRSRAAKPDSGTVRGQIDAEYFMPACEPVYL
jgi:hypothetical protein